MPKRNRWIDTTELSKIRLLSKPLSPYLKKLAQLESPYNKTLIRKYYDGYICYEIRQAQDGTYHLYKLPLYHIMPKYVCLLRKK